MAGMADGGAVDLVRRTVAEAATRALVEDGGDDIALLLG